MADDKDMAEAPTDDSGRSDHLLYYRDAAGNWRWRRTAPNGEIVGSSSEGFREFRDARASFSRSTTYIYDFDVEP